MRCSVLAALLLAACAPLAGNHAAVPHAAAVDLATLRYDAPLSVVLDAMREAATPHFHLVEVLPRQRTVATSWSDTAGPLRMVNSSVGDWVDEAYFWRVDAVAVGGRPWRVAIHVHTAEAGPGMRLASKLPDGGAPWAQQLSSTFLQAVHARLANCAVPATAPSDPALAASAPPPEAVSVEADPAHQLPLEVRFDRSHAGVVRYRPVGLSPAVGEIEGTVNDRSGAGRLAGIAITAYRDDTGQGFQAVTDDAGYFRFDGVPPGTYTVSAYYSLDGRGQVEERRGDVAVAGGDAVVVPLWVELPASDD